MMQLYDKNDDIRGAFMGGLREIQDKAFEAFESGKVKRVVIAQLEPGIRFYVKGLKFEIIEVNDDMTIKAKLMNQSDKV